MQIQARRNECKEYLTQLKVALEEKRKNLFNKVEPLGVKVPEDFSNIKQLCQTLVEEHNNLSQNLKNEQSNAQNALRYHEVRKQLNVFKHEEQKGKLSTLKAISDKAQTELKNKQDELKVKQDERKNLILKTKDEEKMEIEINRLLGNMGVLSFSLKLVDNDKEGQRGQYQIKGHDGRIRPITQLSKGEKNIIAFLYFVLSLKRADSNIRPRVIVLDDPMTSNDDTMQYLIIGEIQRLFRDIKDDNYIIILTHNSHFYLNVRPNTMPSYEKSEMKGLYEKKSFYEKYGVYHLRSSGNFTNIKNIADGKQDFNTSYESLWKELVFLYDADMPDLMLNPCRKICETYLKFTKQDVNIFYGDNRNAKKLFDVNQHSIDDLEAEQNGRTKEEIKSILHDLFKANGAEKHYTVHWKGGGR